jgi:trans-aconitate 2-methyltransferase
MRPRDWDAASYERVSAPLEAMGRDVLDRLQLRGDERVLDAGCGTGRVTAALLERLPRGEVIAVDGSPAMVEQARERLGDAADVRVADLLELELEQPVDAILSTATFHWIADHNRLFTRLRENLVPGGRLAAQCGGQGNVAELEAAARTVGEREPFAPARAGWPGPRNACGGSAGSTSGRGRSPSASSRTSRASISGPSPSARTSSGSTRADATPSSTP